MSVSIIVLFAVFILIAIRGIGKIRLSIWQIMLGGALAVLFTGQIHPLAALLSINLDVMFFLFGMFIVGEALDESGYLFYLSDRLFARARTLDSLMVLILFGIGGMSAFLMNDTLAIIGTPLVLHLARKHEISPKLLLMGLAFAVTIGSSMSPIGNPQNLLVAVAGNVPNPFVTFFSYLLIPTMLNLLLAYLVLRLFFRDQFKGKELKREQEPIKDRKLATLCKISLVLIVTLVILKIALSLSGLGVDFRLTYIALISAFPIVAFSPKRIQIMKRIDWYTLIFFAAMFVLMESVWQSGFFQSIIEGSQVNVSSIPVIFAMSVSLSQLISNVPFVAFYIPMIIQSGSSIRAMMALAASSTIAGNLTILGAASNVIIIQNAEKSGQTLTFLEFAKVGAPLTALNAIVYCLFLVVV